MTKFWVGGSGSWSDSAHWATTTGGAGSTGVPTSADAVVIDSASGASAFTITADTGATAASVLVDNANAKVIQSAAFNSPGSLTLTRGEWDTGIAGNALNLQQFSSVNTNPRTLRLNSSVVTFDTVAVAWATATSTNLTFVPGTSKLVFSGNSPTAQLGTLTYNWIEFNLGNGPSTATGSFKATRVTLNGSLTSNLGQMNFGGNVVIGDPVTGGGIFEAIGHLGARFLVSTTNRGSKRTLTVWGTKDLQHVGFSDITAAGSAAPFSGVALGDCVGNQNIAFDPPMNLYRSGAGGNWTDASYWLTNDVDPDTLEPLTPRAPLAQDTVSVGPEATGTLNIDAARLARNLDFSGFSGTVTYGSGAWEVYGNVTLSGLATYVDPPQLLLSGRGSHLFDPGDVAFDSTIRIDAPGGGGYTLTRDLVAATFFLTNGKLDAGGHDVTLTDFLSTPGNNKRNLILGTGTWTLTGTGVVWSVTSNTALVINPGSATIRISDTSAATKSFIGGGRTYPNLDLGAGGGGAIILTGANTFNTLSATGPKTLRLPISTTTTVKALDTTGGVGTEVAIESATSGTRTTISKSGAAGQTILDHLSLRDLVATGGQWYAGLNSIDRGNNLGWVFGLPSPGLFRMFEMWGVEEPSR